MISVVGYGSLLSEQSARETVPNLDNFRIVRVPGYRRIFNKVGVVFISRHHADPTSLQLASCATEPDPSSEIICSQFECSEEEYVELVEREHRFRWVEVETVEQNGVKATGWMCTTFNDHDYRSKKCHSAEEYYQRVGQFYQGLLWRKDILPFPRYLVFCLQAAAGQGEDVLENFLHHSYLADGTTSIAEYLQQQPDLHNWRQWQVGYSYRSETK